MKEILLESSFHISLDYIVASHGWVRLAPWRWDAHTRELSRLEAINTCDTATVTVSQASNDRFRIQVTKSNLGSCEQKRIVEIVRRWLSIDWNPSGAIETAKRLDTEVARFIELGGGRFLRGSTFYEDLVKTICTINTNWASTIRVVSSLVTELGGGVFPTPGMVLGCGENDLRRRHKLGFRAPVLIDSTNELLRRGIIDHGGNLNDHGISYGELLRLRGIGPYSASHIAMLEHDFSYIPIDSVVSTYCKERFGIDPDGIEKFFDSWGDYRFLGYKIGRNLNHVNPEK